MDKIKAGGIIQNINLAQISILCIPDRPGVASTILSALYEKGINVQFIAQLIELNNRAHIIICISNKDLEKAKLAFDDIKSQVDAKEILYNPDVSIISIFGPHFRDQPGVAKAVFSTLAEANINILAINTSISSISCVIDGSKLKSAVNALMSAFDLPLSSVFTAADGISLRSDKS